MYKTQTLLQLWHMNQHRQEAYVCLYYWLHAFLLLLMTNSCTVHSHGFITWTIEGILFGFIFLLQRNFACILCPLGKGKKIIRRKSSSE